MIDNNIVERVFEQILISGSNENMNLMMRIFGRIIVYYYENVLDVDNKTNRSQ